MKPKPQQPKVSQTEVLKNKKTERRSCQNQIRPPVVTDSTKTCITPSAVDEQQTVEAASVDSSIKSSQCKRPSTDLSTTPPPKKIRTEDSPPPSEQQPEVKKSIVPEQPEGATVA